MRHSYKNINKNKKLIIIRHSKKPPIDLIIAEKHCFLCKKTTLHLHHEHAQPMRIFIAMFTKIMQFSAN